MTSKEINNILAIDTSTRNLHLALAFGGDRLVKSNEMVEKSHGQVLLKKIDNLLQSAGIAVSDIHGIVICLGPGSFTGLRIGLAAAKGIAVASEIPAVGVGLFELASHKLGKTEPTARILIPSRKGEWYVGTMNNQISAEVNVSIETTVDLPSVIGDNPVYGVGSEPVELIKMVGSLSQVRELEYDSADLLYLGRQKLLAGDFSDLSDLEPMYFQKSIAETRFDQRESK